MPTTLPTPVKRSSRICFGISYFLTPEAALEYSAYITQRGDTYNGGLYDGMPTGRDSAFDHEIDGTKYFAVTTR